jgi:signal transduction histidine kinase
MRFNFFNFENKAAHPIPFQKVLWLVYGGMFFLLALDIISYWSGNANDWFSFSNWLIALGMLLVFVLLDVYYHRVQQHVTGKMMFFLLGLRVAATEIYERSQDSLLAPSLLYLALPFVVYRYFGRRACNFSLVGVALRFSIATLITLRHQTNWTSDTEYLLAAVVSIVFDAFVVVLIGAFVENVDQEKKLRLHTEQLMDELEHVHAKIVDLAAAEERNRLARDVHDSLGHYLTVINVQLEKALALQEKSPAVSTQAVVDAKRLTREALQDVRESVAALRTPRVVSFEQQLSTLIQDAAASGLAIDLQVEGNSARCSDHVTTTVYRIVQEAITNIRKHAQTNGAQIKLAFWPEVVTLQVQDHGCGFDMQRVTQGFGLRGLRERVELLSGTMQLESHPGQGTCLLVQLPQNPISTRRFISTAQE